MVLLGYCPMVCRGLGGVNHGESQIIPPARYQSVEEAAVGILTASRMIKMECAIAKDLEFRLECGVQHRELGPGIRSECRPTASLRSMDLEHARAWTLNI